MPDETLNEVQQTLDSVSSTTPLKFEVAGSTFTGATTDEVIQKMLKTIEHGNTTIRTLNDKTALQDQQIQQIRTQQTTAPTSTDAKTPQQIYWEKWQTDPIAAQRYADSVRLGVPEDQVDQIQRQNITNTATTQQSQAGDEFMRRNPDFPSTPETVQLLLASMQRRYQGSGDPRNSVEIADRLEVTFNELKRQGAIQGVDIIPTSTNAARPAPSLGSGGGETRYDATVQSQIDQAYRMPMKDLEKAINELAAKGARR